MMTRCLEDEKYFTEIRQLSVVTSYLQLVDARPQLNAVANVLKGAGTVCVFYFFILFYLLFILFVCFFYFFYAA
jgi:hypothetical protein